MNTLIALAGVLSFRGTRLIWPVEDVGKIWRDDSLWHGTNKRGIAPNSQLEIGHSAEDDAFLVVDQTLLEGRRNPVGLVSTSTGLPELCDIGPDLVRDEFARGKVIAIEADVSTVQSLNGTRTEQICK
jgi:hypothetical protein